MKIKNQIKQERNKGRTVRSALPLVAVMILAFFGAGRAGAQVATAVWGLTANANVTVTGNITATPHVFGSGLTSTTYNSTNGATATNFNGPVCTPNGDDYYEFNLTVNCENDLTITSVSFDHRTSSPTRCFQLKYSTDGITEIQIGGDIPVASTSPVNYNTGPIDITVIQGQSVRFRLYGATGNTSRSLSCRNFTVNGTTAVVSPPLPTLVISASPSGPICPGTTVTFTAVPGNGGPSPTYQWMLNGTNVGSNSPSYQNASLDDGDQVSCMLTSNLLCVSPATVTSNIYTVTLLPTSLAAPGAITGPVTVPINTPGLFYGIAAVPNATSYIWTMPPGWVITSGAGTTGITVTSGSVGSNGNISVSATNGCVVSATSLLAVGVIPPHNVCNQCHISHTSPGVLLTNTPGNANLCISCHNANGSAFNKPFSNAMKAVPGVGGTSHSWDQPAINALFETNMPSNAEMAARTPDGKIICSTCHNQHNPYVFPAYLRTSNDGDAVCKDCHSARNVGTWATNPLTNKGSHPVGVTFNASDPRFLPEPVAPFTYLSSKVECSSCHQAHYSPSADGYLLRAANGNSVCTSCHAEKSPSVYLAHEGFGCKTCHYTHSTDKSNVLMVRNAIITPNSGTLVVAFTSNGSPDHYADATAPFNGICEVCHTATDHYTNTSGGTSDSRHVPANQKCVNCHPHRNAFYPVTDCFDCHKNVTDKPGVGPAGGRRQIVDNTGNGLGTGGDFKRTSHHVGGSVPSVSDCIKCHYMGDHMNGTVKLLDPDLGFLNVITFDPLNKASVESFCLKCHDADGANGSLAPFSDQVPVPVINASTWGLSAHKAVQSCLDCHDNGHGSNKSMMLGPYDYAGPGTGTDLMNEEEAFCLNCHGASGLAGVKVHLAFSSYANTSSDYYKHDPAATYRVHNIHENSGSAFGGANRHVECVDCHNPHAVRSGTATAPALLPALTGVTGVVPVYSGPGSPIGFTWSSSVAAEYQVCFKCHSSFTTLPTYLPGGWDGTAVVTDGLRKLTTGGINNQIEDSRDMAREFNPSNLSFHPVIATGTNPGINAATFATGWGSSSMMYCTSCHNNPLSSIAGQSRGPHGSQNLHILDQASPGGPASDYKTYHNSVSASSGDVCGKCHQAATYWTSGTSSRFGAHDTHMNDEQSECYVCHDTHGSEQMHLINFNRNVPNCITVVTPNSQSSFAHATGAANSCTLTCHGTSHSNSSRTYTPAYP